MPTRGEIVVAGAGAIGSTIAFGLARAGYAVTVVDPAPLGANASGLAAGMLAPAFEALFDEASHDRFKLLAAARDLWPTLADTIGLKLDRAGAMAIGPRHDAETWAADLARLGAPAELLAPMEAKRRSPMVREGRWAAFTAADWRLDALPALEALRRAAVGAGARFVVGAVVNLASGEVSLEGAPPLRADRLILATGAARTLARLAPELSRLTPVKGHILRAAGDFASGPVLRGPGIYVFASGDGMILGASMEPGRDDRDVDARVARELIARAKAVAGGLGELPWRAAAGVRAATSDGLPLVGEGRAKRVILAVGARRNGWLLAPLIAEVVLATLEGRPETPAARLFDPARLNSPG